MSTALLPAFDEGFGIIQGPLPMFGGQPLLQHLLLCEFVRFMPGEAAQPCNAPCPMPNFQQIGNSMQKNIMS